MTGRANPQSAVAVRVKAGNIVAGQTVFGAIRNKFSIFEIIQSAIFRAGPKSAAGIFRDGADGIFRQAIKSREQFPFLSVKISQPALRSRPNLSVATFKQRKNPLAQNLRARRGNKTSSVPLK